MRIERPIRMTRVCSQPQQTVSRPETLVACKWRYLLTVLARRRKPQLLQPCTLAAKARRVHLHLAAALATQIGHIRPVRAEKGHSARLRAALISMGGPLG